MNQRMSVAQYHAILASQPAGRMKSSGRMMRLPALPLDQQPSRRNPALEAGPVKEAGSKEKISSAQKARNRVNVTVEALEAARTEVDYTVLPDGAERVLIRVVGGETLPHNRASNIGREQSKLSQRAFSRYKHACADRMQDAATLLQAQVRQAGAARFNSEFYVVRVCYGRQVTSTARFIDEDAVVISFKYILDGLVTAGVLVDDSRKYVRIGEHLQCVGSEPVLLIELIVQKGMRG